MIAACLKWVDLRPELDATGAVHSDDRFAGVSHADQAALEWALRQGEVMGAPVTVLTVAPPAAERALRSALACGAARAVRVDAPGATDSAAVASALARVLAAEPGASVWCGDHSLDRGSGSVPAFLAAELDLPQALGVVEVLTVDDGVVRVVRRLDGGRRERVRLGPGAVVSVEGAAATLRRAPFRASLAARTAAIEVVPIGAAVAHADAHGPIRPFRPRARVLPPPEGATALERVKALTVSAAGDGAGHGELVTLDPEAAAARILEALREWGELADGRGP
jgi:electron transfer flavoprotein beta subunit